MQRPLRCGDYATLLQRPAHSAFPRELNDLDALRPGARVNGLAGFVLHSTVRMQFTDSDTRRPGIPLERMETPDVLACVEPFTAARPGELELLGRGAIRLRKTSGSVLVSEVSAIRRPYWTEAAPDATATRQKTG